MKKILVLTTGGTIASTEGKNGLSPSISPSELLQFLKFRHQNIEVSTRHLFDIDSTDISPDHWIQIVCAIREEYDAYDGFVVTHGTDTLAYTACALSYMIQNSPKPIVLTGAQKSIQMDITDAKTNLKDAIQFASYDQARDVVVVFGGKIIPGTRARKNRSKSFDAFSSMNYPELGIILDGVIVDYIEQYPQKGDVHFYPELDTDVLLLKLYPGLNPSLLRFALEHYRCIILESYGLGGIPLDLFQLLSDTKDLDNHIFILTTQVPLEGSDILLYEVGRRALSGLPVLESYDMTTEATVTKCMWALQQSRGDMEKFQRLYYRRINFDYSKKFQL